MVLTPADSFFHSPTKSLWRLDECGVFRLVQPGTYAYFPFHVAHVDTYYTSF
jgi:hypothetical protein